LQQEENHSPRRIENNRYEDEVQGPKNSHRKDGSRRTKQFDRASDDLLRSMRKEIDELKNEMKEKTTKNLDGMVKRTDSPFTTKVLECPLPPKFFLPQLEAYDGLKDPLDHITTFKKTLSLQQTPDKIVCRSFLTILKGAARVRFNAQSSIDDFEQLGNLFVRHYVDGQQQKRPANHLLMIRQEKGETLRSYVKQFNKEVIEVDKPRDKVQLPTFKVNLKSKEFVVMLAKSPLESMIELLLKVQKYMNAEDPIAVIRMGDMWKAKRNIQEYSKGKKRGRKDY